MKIAVYIIVRLVTVTFQGKIRKNRKIKIIIFIDVYLDMLCVCYIYVIRFNKT